MLQLLNFGTERSHCSEETVGSQRNENYLGTSEGFSYSESFHSECSRKQGSAAGGLLVIHECFPALVKEESSLHFCGGNNTFLIRAGLGPTPGSEDEPSLTPCYSKESSGAEGS